jgi:O-antigen/teichoic acid export membrane protein
MHITDTRAAISTGSLGHKLARNTSFLLVGQVATLAFSVVLTALLGRLLGAAEFGTYYLLVVTSTFAFVFVDWGQSMLLIREAARRPEKDGQFLGGALAFRTAVIFAAAPATAVLMKVIGYDSRIEFLVLCAIVCGLPLMLAQVYTFMFRGRDRMDLDATVGVIGKALTVAVTVPVLFLGGGLGSVLLMQAVGGAGALLVAVLLARRMRLVARRPDLGIFKELVSGGAPVAAFLIAVTVQPFTDIIILSRLVPPEVVGWYGAARNIMGLLFLPATILCNASFPELSRMSHSIPDLRRALRATLRVLLVIGALAAAGTTVFANVAVNLIYGHGHFDPAVPMVQIFAPILPLFFVGMSYGATITAVGKTKQMAVAKVLSVVAGTGLDFLLIPMCQDRWGNGGIGLVLAFGASEVVMLFAYLWLLPRGTADRASVLDFLRAAAAAAGTVMIFWMLPSVTPWLAMPACVLVFVALAYACGLVLWTDLEKVADLIRARLARV